MKMLAMMSLILTSLTLSANHPMMFMVLVLLQAMNTCLLAWAMSSSSWLSYTLFLIFIGGLMILFIYTTSLAPNEMFSLNTTSSPLTLILLLLSIPLASAFFNSTATQPSYSTYLQLAPSLSSLVSPLTVMIMSYLLLTLVVVIKTANKTKGPLRNSIKNN